MSYITAEKTFPGATVTTLDLAGTPDYASTQISFSGRATGTVTVTAKAFGSDAYDPVSGGAINLASVKSLVIAGYSLDSIKFSDAGTGAYSVTVIQRN